MGVVVFFILQGDVTNKIERCLKLRTFSSDVGFPGTRSKNITVLCNHCCKVNTIPRWMQKERKLIKTIQCDCRTRRLVDIENLFAQVNFISFSDRLNNNLSCIKSFFCSLNTRFRYLYFTNSRPSCPHRHGRGYGHWDDFSSFPFASSVSLISTMAASSRR